MPYIVPDRRPQIERFLRDLCNGDVPGPQDAPMNCGELNYAFCTVCLHGNEFNGPRYSGEETLYQTAARYLEAAPMSYQRVNDVIGAFEAAGREFIRRKPGKWTETTVAVLKFVADRIYTDFAASYEDGKIRTNGDLKF